MVTYDWRRCPYPNQAPSGPANYGPLGADVGTRAADLPLDIGPFPPSQSLIDTTVGCPPDMFAWTVAGVAALMLLSGKKR